MSNKNYKVDFTPGMFTFTGTGDHFLGNSYSVPGLQSCLGLICIPLFEGGKFFMMHSANGPYHPNAEREFWNYWAVNKYFQGARRFLIVYKVINSNSSMNAYFGRKLSPAPGSHLSGEIGKRGDLVVITEKPTVANGNKASYRVLDDKNVLDQREIREKFLGEIHVSQPNTILLGTSPYNGKHPYKEDVRKSNTFFTKKKVHQNYMPKDRLDEQK